MKKLLAFLLLASTTLLSNTLSWPSWHWSDFELYNYLENGNQSLNKKEIESYLDKCIKNMSDENCDDTIVMMILLSRLGAKSTINYANILLSMVSNVKNVDFNYIRPYAIRALARSGEIDQLLSYIITNKSNKPMLEDIYILMQIQDYRWVDIFRDYLKGNNANNYCSALG